MSETGIKAVVTERVKVQKERLEICNSCEHYKPDYNKCEVCGCLMSYKTLFPWATCPEGKWGKTLPPTA